MCTPSVRIGQVLATAFSSDGTRLAISGADNIVNVYSYKYDISNSDEIILDDQKFDTVKQFTEYSIFKALKEA